MLKELDGIHVNIAKIKGHGHEPIIGNFLFYPSVDIVSDSPVQFHEHNGRGIECPTILVPISAGVEFIPTHDIIEHHSLATHLC